ncbi:endonuclease I family protein [Halobacteriovorax sp. HLS]|uniref:endonuclease I family protein n=1 Tax=Halobacteriovorax sp. HLS TaxID=2234000 RepID=UPI0013E2B1F7|nr:endonuclease [Halobacteriovorax sp. HLS]
MMNKFMFTLVITLVSLNSWSALEDYTYYPKSIIDTLRSNDHSEIKEELYTILSSYHQKTSKRDIIKSDCTDSSNCYIQKKGISYKQARIELFGNLHIERSPLGRYRVKDLYCEKYYGKENGVKPGSIPNSRVMNCEHTWPQSRFNPQMSKLLQKTDLHHLYPVSSRANSSRSNHIFAEVNGNAVNDNCKSSKRGMAYGSSITAFEPPANHKGNVARALFYFSVRFKIQIDPLEERYLRQWHQEDPVDQEEIDRNDKIFAFQKNRNPFIDEPLLVTYINDF